VVARTGEVRRIELEDDSHPGCVVAADVRLDGGARHTAISLYGLQEYRKHIDGEPYRLRYAVTAVHRILSDLTPLIDLHGRSRVKRPLVLGGDLNVSSQIDPPDRRRHREVLERFAGLGLKDTWAAAPDSIRAPDCTCEDQPCRHVRTHTHGRSPRPWQLDYVFANPAWKPISAETHLDEDTWTRSDHAPVVVRLAATEDIG
jgi:endonuclease/exonuclease/phosphatase family metal-dependent hydrolase